MSFDKMIEDVRYSIGVMDQLRAEVLRLREQLKIERAALQAAVDEIASDEKQYDDEIEPEIAGGLEMARNAIFKHTGITPKEK